MTLSAVEKTIQELDGILVNFMNEHKLPGLAVGIVQDGKLVAEKYLGYADLDKKENVSPETIFRIGSISKTFTGVGIMQLWEQGKLDLDDPVNKYLKTYKVQHVDPAAPPVTIRHMLTHTSGIGEVTSLLDFLKPVAGLGAKPETPEVPLSEYYKGCLRPEVYPGEKWAYANHAFATLGQIIEDVSGLPFAEYMREFVFAPLGMSDSSFLLTETLRSRLAKAYDFKKGHFAPVEYLRIEVPAAGSVFSNVQEMSKYVAALMNDGANENGQIVKPETLELMFTPQLDFDERLGVNIGLYFVMTRFGEHRISWHNGGWPGFVSSMFIAPDDKLGVLVFTNTTSPAPDLIAMQLLRKMLGEPEPTTLVPDPKVLEAPHDWPALCGFYGPKKGFLTNLRIWGNYGGEMEVLTRENHLVLRSLTGSLAKGITLYRAANDQRLLYKGVTGKSVITVLFGTNAEGEVTRLQTGPEVYYKRPLVKSLRFKVMALASSIGGLVLALFLKKILRKK